MLKIVVSEKKKNSFNWVLLVCVLIALVVLDIHFEVISVNICSGSGNGHGIRMLAYNVHSEANGFSASSPKMMKMILEENPDFVYLTEYYEGTDETLQQTLEQHYPYVNRKHRWGANEGEAFYSQWQIDSVWRIKLSGHFSAIFRVQIHKETDTLAIYCCHLSSNNLKLGEGRWASLEEGRKLRAKEADAIIEALQKEQYPAIVMGDMNDVSGSYALRRLEAAGLDDAWWDGGLGYGSTYSEGWLKLRIDHILYDKKKLNLKFVDVVGDYKCSDHRAVLAGLEKLSH